MYSILYAKADKVSQNTIGNNLGRYIRIQIERRERHHFVFGRKRRGIVKPVVL